MATNHKPLTVDARPTKEFFVEMLTRDVRMAMAILDLVDNSIDGAIRMRGNGSFQGLTVGITFDSERFIIEDNCGGIPLDLAMNHCVSVWKADGRAHRRPLCWTFRRGDETCPVQIGASIRYRDHQSERNLWHSWGRNRLVKSRRRLGISRGGLGHF